MRTVYLGTAETIMNAMMSGRSPLAGLDALTLASRPFGGAALMLYINELSGFTEICDRYLGSGRSDSSPGAYLFTAIANRLVHPTSKNGIEEWYRKRSALYWLDDGGDDLAGVTTKKDGRRLSLSGQNIWNYMDLLTDDAMDSIWRDVTTRIRESLSIKDETFFFDTTNFFDYVDDETNEEKGNELTRRGYSKQHRSDKNQVSLGLFMGGESMIPYSHETYAGNVKDCTHFGDVVEDLKGFLKRFGRENVTLVIDKGCSTAENVSRMKGYFFISTLKREEVPSSLLREELRECCVNEKGREVYSSSGEYDVKGVRAKVVCSFSESLRRKHETRFRREMEKSEELFGSKEGHAFRSEKAAYRFAEKALPRNFRRAIKYDVTKTLDGNGFRLTWNRNEEAITRMRRDSFGRNFIFTTRLDWSDERIIRSYRSMYRIENQFRLLHSSMLVPVCPVRHWTDQKIEAHIFLCMVGLLFARAIEYVARTRGLVAPSHDEGVETTKPVSYSRIIDAAENIQLVMTTSSERAGTEEKRGRRRRLGFKLSNADEQFNRSILETFELMRFVPGHRT